MRMDLRRMSTESASGTTVDDVSGFTLLEGETAYFNMRPSLSAWLANTRNLVLTFATLGLWLVAGYLWMINSRYVVTDERVYRKLGILRKRTDEYRYEDIQQFTTGKRLIERIIGVGNLQFQTGTGGEAIIFDGVKNHDEVANTIRNQLR